MLHAESAQFEVGDEFVRSLLDVDVEDSRIILNRRIIAFEAKAVRGTITICNRFELDRLIDN